MKENVKIVDTKDLFTKEEMDKPNKITPIAKEKKTSQTSKSCVKKTVLEPEMFIEFNQKKYNETDFVKIIKDIWKYDYKKKVNEMKKVTFYVKPEESTVYYVINGVEEGKFLI